MHRPVVLVAQLDQVVEVGGAAVDPVPDVVDVRELHVGAPGEAATLVTAADDDPLGVRGVPASATQIERVTIRAVARQEDLGVAGQAPGDLG